jgi:hypothetical protein
MKAAEINVGDVVAVTEGTSRWDRNTDRVTKAEVLTVPEDGCVSVRLLEEPKTVLGRRGWGTQKPYKKGDRARIKTSWLWVPWSEIAVMVKADLEATQRSREAEAEREEMRVALQARVDAAIGTDNSQLSWGWIGGVTISIEDLEALLNRAERMKNE